MSLFHSLSIVYFNRWSAVQDFVDAINSHKERTIKAGTELCSDESISRWYGLGGQWINIGLPHYVHLDR
eukprot:Pgem_evm1s17250